MIKHILISFLLFCTIFLCACNKKPETKWAFYYWKTDFKIDAEGRNLLKQAPAKGIYLRFFDIKWNDQKNEPQPVAKVKISQLPEGVSIIPVVYITNKTFLKLENNAIDTLAANTFRLINHIAQNHQISYQNIQIDCDWSLKTKDRYFQFLRSLQRFSDKKLEATIRLHQVKYKSTTGVPPVTKGVLMFYNMGKLNSDLNAESSIYNSKDAAKYINYIKSYPLHLNIALPLFSWVIHIRNGKIIGLYSKIDRKSLQNRSEFSLLKNGFISKKSFFYKGVYVKENDIFKLEETNPELLERAAEQLSEALPVNNERTLIFYELANIDHSLFKAKTFHEISALF